jgi:hypothetical protein
VKSPSARSGVKRPSSEKKVLSRQPRVVRPSLVCCVRVCSVLGLRVFCCAIA